MRVMSPVGWLLLLYLIVGVPGVANAGAADVARQWSSRLAQDLDPGFTALAGQMGSGSEAESLTALGALAEIEQFPAGACWAFARAVALQPTNATYLNNFAFTLMQLSQDDDATTVIEEALAREKNATFYNTLARVCLRKKDCKRAMEAIRKAIALEPKEPQWHLTRIEIVMSCAAFQSSPAAVNEASTGFREGTEEDLDEVLNETLGTLERIMQATLDDIERCMEINRILAARAKAGVADFTYYEKSHETFEHRNRALGTLPARIQEMHEASVKNLRELREAVRQANYMTVAIQHDNFLAHCIGAVMNHCFMYIAFTSKLDALFWTELLGGTDNEVAESYWMEDSVFAPHIYELCDRCFAVRKERDAIHKQAKKELDALPIGGDPDPIIARENARLEDADRRYYGDIRSVLQAIYSEWNPWARKTQDLWLEGTARWIGERWYWVAVARNCKYYLSGRFVTPPGGMPGATAGPSVFQRMVEGAEQPLIKAASLCGTGGLDDRFREPGQEMRRKLQWCQPQEGTHMHFIVDGKEDSVDVPREISFMHSYWTDQQQPQDDPRSYAEIDAALAAYALNHVGSLVLDRTIDVGVAKCQVGSDGSLSGEVKLKGLGFVSPAVGAKYDVRTGAVQMEIRADISILSVLKTFTSTTAEGQKAYTYIKPVAPDPVKSFLTTKVSQKLRYTSSAARGGDVFFGFGYDLPIAPYFEDLLPADRYLPPKGEIRLTEIYGGLGAMMGIGGTR